MPRKKLSEQGVAKLKPPPSGKQIDYYDAHMPGLVLRVNYGGAKIWRALHYVKRPGKNGKQVSIPTTFKLGRYPTLKLKEAREKARQFLDNPQKAKAKAATGSFFQVAENFLVRYVKAQKLRSQHEIVRVLRTQIYPHWRDRNFEEIRRGDVTALLDALEDKNGPRAADTALAIIRKMMNWHATRNEDYITPVVRGMHRSRRNKRSRWLSNDEIRALWAACDGFGTFGALVRVLLVTGQRRDKVATMKWDDLADGEWRIAREEREKGAAERLRLPQLVRDIIAAQPRIAGYAYVFPAPRGSGPFRSFSQSKVKLNARMPEGTESWVLHDLRRTARKLMTRAGVRVDVGELALGHSIEGIRAHYDDPVEYQPMIDAAIQAVADEIARILNPPSDNVLSMPRRAQAQR